MKRQLRALTVCFAAIGAAAADEPAGTIQIERCTERWLLTVEIEQRPPYTAELCRDSIFTDLYLAGDTQFPELWAKPKWQTEQVSLALAQSEGGPALWLGALDLTRSDWQALPPVDRGPAARLKFAALPINDAGLVQIHAIRAANSEILPALLAVSDLKVRSSAPLKLKTTFGFRAIDPATIITLIADEEGLALSWDASGAITLQRPRDIERVLAVIEQINGIQQAAFDGDAQAQAQLNRNYAELQSLGKLRGANDVPPDVSAQLNNLALDLRRDQNWPALIQLRRDLLALARVYDARKDALRVAITQANLAFALQQAATTGDEDRDLLRAAQAQLLKHAPSIDARDLSDYAKALTRRGFKRSALTLLEGGFRACSVDDPLVWLLEFEGLSWALLERYRQAQQAEKAAPVVAQWQACMVGQTTLAQAIRIGDTMDRLHAGQFIEAAADFELIFLRLPALATLDSSEMFWLLQSAALANLAAGHDARAAELLQLASRTFAARGGDDSVRPDAVRAAHTLLNALAAQSSQEKTFFNQRYRTDEALSADLQAPPVERPASFPSLDLLATLLTGLAQRPDFAQGAKRGRIGPRCLSRSTHAKRRAAAAGRSARATRKSRCHTCTATNTSTRTATTAENRAATAFQAIAVNNHIDSPLSPSN
jgi:hypothetical protein